MSRWNNIVTWMYVKKSLTEISKCYKLIYVTTRLSCANVANCICSIPAWSIWFTAIIWETIKCNGTDLFNQVAMKIDEIEEFYRVYNKDKQNLWLDIELNWVYNNETLSSLNYGNTSQYWFKIFVLLVIYIFRKFIDFD